MQIPYFIAKKSSYEDAPIKVIAQRIVDYVFTLHAGRKKLGHVLAIAGGDSGTLYGFAFEAKRNSNRGPVIRAAAARIYESHGIGASAGASNRGAGW